MVFELMSPTGVLLRRDAVACGYDDNHLARLVRRGALHRIRQGAYAPGPTWRAASARQQHELRCEAVVRQYEPTVALSHDSAVVQHSGRDYGLELGSVHLTHFHGKGRRTAGVVHHQGSCGVLDLTRGAERWVTAPVRTVHDITIARGLKVGVVVADDFIRRKLMSSVELISSVPRTANWPGALPIRLVAALATGRAESVGESLGFLLFREQRLVRPVQQFEVFGPDGHLAGRTDWAWPELRILGEFDGVQKYVRYLEPNESVDDVVVREKKREDRLRELTGWTFIRLVWADLFQPERTAGRIRALAAPAA